MEPSGDEGKTVIWYFITALSVGGAEQTLVSLANNLDHEIYDVTVWTIFEQNPLADKLDDSVTLRTLGVQGVTPDENDYYVERAAKRIDYVRAPIRFLQAARNERPDIIQSFLFYDNVIARFAGIVSPATRIITGVRAVPNQSERVVALLDRVTMPLSERVVSNSKSGAELAVQRGAANEDVAVVYNGRDLSAYGSSSGEGVYPELGIPEDATLVGCVGRLVERKGHSDILSAWPGIRQDHQSAHLLLVGDGPERTSLRAKVHCHGCADSVHFLGFRDDIPRLLHALDVFVFPSHFEGLPGALIEAMAASLPLVATPVNGNSELIDGYKTGLFVSVRNPQEIRWAVSRLIDNPNLANALGKSARLKAEQTFSVQQMVNNFERLYESCRRSASE